MSVLWALEYEGRDCLGGQPCGSIKRRSIRGPYEAEELRERFFLAQRPAVSQGTQLYHPHCTFLAHCFTKISIYYLYMPVIPWYLPDKQAIHGRLFAIS